MKFRSAVDWWYYLVIALVVVTLWFSLAPLVRTGQISMILAVVLVVSSLGPLIWLLVSTFYRIDGELLEIKSGPFRWRLKVLEIVSATPRRSLWSSPALSLDRIELKYESTKKIMVSPKDKQGFLREIGKV